MTISDTYREMLLEEFLKETYSSGVLVSAEELETEVNNLIATMDLSVPQFLATDHTVDRLVASSSAGFNSTMNAIRQDLRALYKNMIVLSGQAIDTAPRWKIEAEALEQRLINLEDRVENLLLLTQDTEGYHSYLADNFGDMSQVDFSNTTAAVNIREGVVSLAAAADSNDRLFLEDLDTKTDVIFRIQTTSDFSSRTDQQGAVLADIFKQQYKGWWTSVEMNKVKPVTCELTVKLSGAAVPISKITLELLDSSQSSTMSITPLYSTDNVNFAQLPSITFTQEAKSQAVFQFPETQMQWVKFLLTKKGPDPEVSSPTTFSYQFGFKSIAFYSESFSTTEQTVISRPLWVADPDGNPVEFEKLTLEACEQEEEGTTIDWSVAVSNDSPFTINSNTIWTPLSPNNRPTPVHPTVVEVGDITEIVLGDTETVSISYEGDSTDSDYISPGSTFHLIEDTGSSVSDTELTVSGVRFTFANSNDRLLNYQIDSDLQYDPLSLQVFRNVGEQGLKDIAGDQVRGVQRGWGFEDPWYFCVIKIDSPAGMSIDIGDTPMIIDDVRYTGLVAPTVLTGETISTTGIHRVRVHKSRWKHITPLLDTLSALRAVDSLYPYNHKLLIEGYAYETQYPTTSEKVYQGADLFAQALTRKVSVFDFNNNLKTADYNFFALDIDAPHTSSTGSSPSRVFLIKVDEENSDFQNERFMIKFKLINQLRTYLRVRADLATSDDSVAPVIHSYKVKLA